MVSDNNDGAASRFAIPGRFDSGDHYMTTAPLTGELLTLRYVTLDDALGWLWDVNPKLHDLAQLVASIRHHGFRDPSIYDSELCAISAGNGRLAALGQMRSDGEDAPRGVGLGPDGAWHVPLIFGVDAASQALAAQFAVDHNNLTFAGFDAVEVARVWRQSDYLALLKRLQAEDALPISVADDDFAMLVALLDETTVEAASDPGADLDHAQELQEQWSTARGQLWLIPSQTVPGQAQRLLCGDSTDSADVTRLMDGARAALFATDPPYLVDYDGTNHPSKWGASDSKKNKDWSATYHDWDAVAQGEGLYDGFVQQAVEIAIAPDAAWYCWHASRRQAMLEAVWERYGAFVHQQIIWAKDRPVLTRSWYMWQHEPCFFGWIKGNKPRRVAQDHPATVWHVPTIAPGTSTDHPTSKPVELFALPMLQHTLPGAVCYEPFAGSGSQLVAGEQTGRLVYGMELQPVYVAVILERLSGMGLVPVLDEG